MHPNSSLYNAATLEPLRACVCAGAIVNAGIFLTPIIAPHSKWLSTAAEHPWSVVLNSLFQESTGGVVTLSILTLSRTSTPWADVGSEIGRHTFEINPPPMSPLALANIRPMWHELGPTTPTLTLACVAGGGWLVSGNGLQVHVGADGVLGSFVVSF